MCPFTLLFSLLSGGLEGTLETMKDVVVRTSWESLVNGVETGVLSRFDEGAYTSFSSNSCLSRGVPGRGECIHSNITSNSCISLAFTVRVNV